MPRGSLSVALMIRLSRVCGQTQSVRKKHSKAPPKMSMLSTLVQSRPSTPPSPTLLQKALVAAKPANISVINSGWRSRKTKNFGAAPAK